MNRESAMHPLRASIASILVLSAASAGAQSFHASTFATGTAVQATNPDSVALTKNSVWVSYTNNTTGRGQGGSSTVVRYRLNGSVQKTYSIAGSVDGLKVDPSSGLVWALQNQDANSTLTLINTEENTVSQPIPYASFKRGVDDVAFKAGQAYVSTTSPKSPGDATIELVQEDSNPVVLTPILLAGATGTNLATGAPNQPTPQSDPDSLKTTPEGDLMLSSANDGSLVFVERPGTPKQSVSFLKLLDHSNNPLTSVDDAIFATAHKGTFFIADSGNNRVLKIDADDLRVGSLYVSADALNVFAAVNLKTGVVTPVPGVTGLNGPAGIEFMARADGDGECSNNNSSSSAL
ncbi:MAG TPA: hypothetical protein VGN30_15270 [Steroidobacteraceae bacterium]